MPTPQQETAHRAVDKALRSGALRRSDACERCGARGSSTIGHGIRLQAHHADYAKPLDVEWLCPNCHKLHHQPPTGELQTITFRLRRHEDAELRRRAVDASMTVSDFVRRELGLRGQAANDVSARVDNIDNAIERVDHNIASLVTATQAIFRRLERLEQLANGATQ